MNPTDITGELLLAYELSLAVGQTLDPHATCRDFLRILVARRNLIGASIWWLKEHEAGLSAQELALLDAIPRSQVSAERLPLTHPLWQLSRSGEARFFTSENGEFASLVSDTGGKCGACALFPLGERGVLTMNSPTPTAFTPRVLGQLRAVVAKLETAIQGGMAFTRLQQSEAALRETNQRLAEAQRASEQSAAQLEQAHSHLKTLVHTLPDLIWLKDPEGVYLACNPRFERYFGTREEGILGKRDYDFMDRDLAEFFREYDRIAMAKGGPSVNEEWITFADDGHRELLETTKTPMYDAHGRLIGILGIGHDITERKRVEQRLAMAIEVTQLVFWEWDLASDRLLFDQAMLPSLGLDPDQAFESFRGWIESIHPEDRGPFMERAQRVLQPGGALFDFEYRMRNKAGQYHWIHTKGRVTRRDETGQATFALGTSMNITARKRIEEELRASEQKLLTILESVDAYIYLKDAEGCYLFANRPVRELWQAEMADIVGSSDEKFFDEATTANLRRNDLRVLTGGETLRTEEINTVIATGKTTVYQTTKLPLHRQDGSIYALCGISTDITTRKKAEIALAESEAQLRTLIEAVPDSIQFKDGEGRWLIANNVCLHIFGLEGKSWRGLTDMEIGMRHPQLKTTMASCKASDDAAWSSGSSHRTEERIVDGEGKASHFDIIKVPLFDERNQRHAMVIIGRDMTERKRIEAELAQHRIHLEELVQERTDALMETEARASHILQSSADGLFGMDAEERISFINPAGCRMLGLTSEQVVGRSPHDLFHHSTPEGTPYPKTECPVLMALRQGRETRVDDEVFWHTDGHAIPVMYAVHPNLKDGEINGAVVSFVDMSAQRAAAQAREQALAAAEHLARVRSEFLANMSHEIRTPMNGVLGFAQIGYRNSQDSEKARNAFEKILGSGNRLLGVINDILDFSKVEAGKLHIEAVAMSLPEAMDRAMELVAHRAHAKGLDLRLEVAPDLPHACVCDPLRLGQILLNLLSNAVKFTDAGHVTLAASFQDGQLLFRVTDTGIGMDETQLGLLFNPFRQADGSTTRRFGGTGLGLAITKRLLELMGGDIGVESRPGVGSRFEVRLPYVPAEALASDGDPGQTLETTRPEKPLAGISILVAEDDAINQMILEENLLEDGAQVTMVTDGHEAVESVRRGGRHAYDVVLMDVQMPVLDGYEATRRILALAPDLPIIGQTAHAFGEERKKCFEAGMVAHIAKPIDPEALVKLLRQFVPRPWVPRAGPTPSDS
jgi:PAS domain S-box-containing protein